MPETQSTTYSRQARRVIGYLFGLKREAPVLVSFWTLTQIIGVSASAAIAPIFVSKLLGQIAKGAADWHNSRGLLLGYAISLIIGEIITVRISMAFAYLAETRMQLKNSQQVMDSQMNKSLDFHANRMSGGIVSDATKLNGSIERFWDTLMFTAVPIAVTVLSVCVALSFLVWQYAAILFLLALTIAGFIVRSQNSIAPISRKVSEKSSGLTAYLADVIANISAVKAFAAGKYEQAAYDRLLADWRAANMKEMRKVLIVTGSFGAVMVVMNVIAFLVAVIVTQHHVASIGPTYLVIGYTLNVVSQLWQISSATRIYIRIIGDAAPMIAMLGEPAGLNDPAEPVPVKIQNGEIEFKQVSFGHDGASQVLFNDLNLHIDPGQKIGLVGHSGAGKTTFTRLLLRFSDIESGEILIDGQNIAAVTQDSLRSRIAYVPQEPLLFHRTIAENIGYGKGDVKQSEVEKAAELAHAHEFIKDLPKGYETLVGERGVKLSGGQRQRVAIARAMIKDAPILVLDEATSALDSESEKLIQSALWKLMEGRTAIVIAHRLSTIQRMDRIVVLEDGKIVEQGSHKELLAKKNGVYARLWKHQSGGFLDD